MSVSQIIRSEPGAEFLANPEIQNHVVQFYEADDQLLARNVGKYLEEGLRGGEAALVIASADHCEAFNGNWII